MSSARTRRAPTRFRPAPVEACEERVLLSGLTLHAHHLTASSLHLDAARIHHAQYRDTAPKTNLASATSAAPAFAHPMLVRKATTIVPFKGGKGGGGGGGTGSPPAIALTPAQVRHIYSFDQISNLGSGQTIAIVDAYDDPNILSDADVFDKQFHTTLNGTTSYYTAYGASTTWLTKAFPSGTTPPGNTGWGQEISLDVEWAHAIAPLAHILLVEANSNSYSDLLAADDYAVSHGATVISNSWGGGEFSGETSYDSHFTASGVTFVFSAGDSGNQSYPASSPYVLAVGGTTLSHDSSYNWTGESGWSSGGGGVERGRGEAVVPVESALRHPGDPGCRLRRQPE